MRIAASSVCACSGQHPYESSFDGWLVVLKRNFPTEMAAHTKAFPEFKTKRERAHAEVREMGATKTAAVHDAIKSYVTTGQSQDLLKAQVGLSPATFTQICSEAQCKRGTSKEKAGLAQTAERDKAGAEKCHTAVAEASARVLEAELEGEATKKKIEFDTQISEALKADLKRKVEEDVVERQAKLVECAEKNSKKARMLEAPMKQQLSLQTMLAEDVYLTGKMDAIQGVVGESIVITEHKNRQSRLFGYVKDYERIQCLAYLHLVKSEQHLLGWDPVNSRIVPPIVSKPLQSTSSAIASVETPFACVPVTCRLVETHGHEERGDDVGIDDALWSSTTECLLARSSRLKAVISDGASLLAEMKKLTDGSSVRGC